MSTAEGEPAIGFDPDDPALAARYDELPLWSAPFGQLILDRVPLGAGQITLDVGTGTGFLAVEIAQRCGPGARVFALDTWSLALDVLRVKLTHLGLPTVTVLERDAADTGLPDASVDVVVSNLGVNNFAAPADVMLECRRVLRPGGRLLVSSNLVGHMVEFYDVLRETLVAAGRTDRLPALRAEIGHRATVEAAVELLSDHGLVVNDVVRAAFRWRFADGAALFAHRFVRLGFLPGWLAVVGEQGRDEIMTELQQRLDARAATEGELALTIPMVCIDASRT